MITRNLFDFVGIAKNTFKLLFENLHGFILNVSPCSEASGVARGVDITTLGFNPKIQNIYWVKTRFEWEFSPRHKCRGNSILILSSQLLC
ncbi:MAG: hypothetical protein DRP93_00380 [Candidatus Neomarinimicrobiota bacterium]|nr:MAG: hypothetical protein DRP93_00380 [Candidatus Neomarinimicrobiota bacterium]